MALPPRAEAVAAAAVLLLCGAFIVSFIVGLDGAGSAPARDIPATPPLIVPDRVAGRIEVLNASGRTGLARIATERLRHAGFDVVYFGNAASFRDSSLVLDRTGNTAIARAAARRLGITSVRTERDSTLFVDATILLGTDWHVNPDSAAEQRTDGGPSRLRR